MWGWLDGLTRLDVGEKQRRPEGEGCCSEASLHSDSRKILSTGEGGLLYWELISSKRSVEFSMVWLLLVTSFSRIPPGSAAQCTHLVV